MRRIGLSWLVAHATLATLLAAKWGGLALLAQQRANRQRLWPAAVGFWDRALAGYPLPGNWSIYDAARCASLFDVPSIFAAGLIAGFTCFAYSKGLRPAVPPGPAPEPEKD